MNVVKAGIEDIDTLVEMRLGYLTEDNGGIDGSDSEAIRRDLPGYFRLHLGRDLHAYVIRNGRSIVSCAFLLIVEKPMSPAFINGRTGIVLNVYTFPACRRRGYARMIMKRLMEDAKEMELSVVELKSTQDGYDLYRSVGFAEEDSKYRMMKWRGNGSAR